MSISSAQPVQFWASNTETYNEKQICGVTPECWCQKFQIDENIYVVAPSEYDPQDISLLILDEDGNVVEDLGTFDSTGVTFWSTSTPGGYQMVIVDPVNTTLLAPSSWIDFGTAFSSKTATQFIKTNTVNGTDYGARQAGTVSNNPDRTLSMNIHIKITNNASDNWIVRFSFFNATDPVWEASVSGNGNVDSDYVIEFTKDPAEDDSINLILSANVEVNGANIEITIVPGDVVDQNSTLYKSDCIDIKEEHPCTNLITYYNASDFAGIPYAGASPAIQMKIRIESRFLHEQFPREDKVVELSTREFLRTYTRIESKKLFEMGYMPFYMWKKLNLIFAHDFVMIEDEYWVLQNGDPVTIEENGRKDYPLHRGAALLTEKDFVKRNLL